MVEVSPTLPPVYVVSNWLPGLFVLLKNVLLKNVLLKGFLLKNVLLKNVCMSRSAAF